MTKELMIKKMKLFNETYKLFYKGFSILKREFKGKEYKAEFTAIIIAEEKVNQLHKIILKSMESDCINEEFRQIIKKLI